jgi:putative acetyltransferase
MSIPSVTIRPTKPADQLAIRSVLRAAFPTDAEARLVELLTARGKATISLVAEVEGDVVGHILFSPATWEGKAPSEPRLSGSITLPLDRPADPAVSTGLGLAPVAVHPDFQNVGIGSALIRAGLAECRRLGIPWVVLLGHETYYPRFGFAPASRWNLSGDYGSHDAFQFLPLAAAAAASTGGHIRYASEFGELFPD